MNKEAQSDIKKLIDKGTPSSAMMALGMIFKQFMNKNTALMKSLPRPMFDKMVHYVKEDVFKYARLSPNVKLKNFLERYQREVGSIEEVLPGPASKHFMNLLKAVSKPSVQKVQPKAPAKGEKPGEAPVKEQKPGETPVKEQKTQKGQPAKKPEDKAQIPDEQKAMKTLSNYLKKNNYKQLWPKLPMKVQHDLDTVGLAPTELKIGSLSGLRVASRFLEGR